MAEDPKRHQVSFLAEKPAAAAALEETAAGDERVVCHGREIYSWHPDGVASVKAGDRPVGQEARDRATARNWTTVTTLLEMAGG